MRWLADIKMPHPSQQVVLQEYIGTVNQCKERVQRLTEQIQQLLPEWQLFPVFRHFKACAAFQLIVAATTVAEIGDLKRFQNRRGNDELPGPGAFGALQWPEDQTRSDYQGRQWTCAPCPDRSRLGLSVTGPGQPGIAQTTRRTCRNPFARLPGKPNCGYVRATVAFGIRAKPNRLS
jgi:hypothetical protein